MSTEFLFVWISDERQSSKGLTNKTIGRRKHYHAHRCIWVFYFYPANVFLSFDSLASFSCFIFLLRRMVEESFRFGKFPFWFWNELRTHLARNGDFLMLAVIFIQAKFTYFCNRVSRTSQYLRHFFQQSLVSSTFTPVEPRKLNQRVYGTNVNCFNCFNSNIYRVNLCTASLASRFDK